MKTIKKRCPVGFTGERLGSCVLDMYGNIFDLVNNFFKNTC